MGNYRLTRRGKIVLLILILLLCFLIYAVFSRLYGNKTPQLEPNPVNNNINKENINSEEEYKDLDGYTNEELELLRSFRITLYFLPDSPVLIEGEIYKLKDFPLYEEKLILEGNINGYPDFNDTDFGIWLGNERASVVKEYLVEQGFLDDKIEIINNGSKKPVNKDGSKEELVKNRRVEIYYYYKD